VCHNKEVLLDNILREVLLDSTLSSSNPSNIFISNSPLATNHQDLRSLL